MTAPATYRALPVVVEALQWTGSNTAEVLAFCPKARFVGSSLVVETLEGPLRVELYAWLLKGSVGEFWPVRDGVFGRKYEPVPGGAL
jgi:hypothetical protein